MKDVIVEIGQTDPIYLELSARARRNMREVGVSVDDIERLFADHPTRIRCYLPSRRRQGRGRIEREVRLACFDRSINRLLYERLGRGKPDFSEAMWTKAVGRNATSHARRPAFRRPVAA